MSVFGMKMSKKVIGGDKSSFRHCVCQLERYQSTSFWKRKNEIFSVVPV